MAKITVNSDTLQQKKNLEIDKKRIQAYREESDPLFFKVQRGEIEELEWINKIQEIKQRFPKV